MFKKSPARVGIDADAKMNRIFLTQHGHYRLRLLGRSQ